MTSTKKLQLASLAETIQELTQRLKLHDLQGDALQKRLNHAIDLLQTRCPHPTTTDRTSYYGGSYYDRASTTHSLTCTLCDKVLKTWDVTHSYYG